jgi:flavin reductase (DIM6/NTAB) family NADH-FMN oxidoreductase RutF
VPRFDRCLRYESDLPLFFDLSTATAHETCNLLIGAFAPRPFAWITSVDLAGAINAAPFSAYN